ncbi:SH3 domain-containing protein [Devosia sp.]|uniref:SH3 domain-containing protein n=1 Tax=Devosia sp. TaxID=1871048 RepID=UPI0025BB6124|nr:SH3 domain-containing protein [Devosia sp.]
MALSKKLMAGGLAALALLATTATAFAAPAYATGNVNVRSGPGTGYSRIDTLRRGEQVDVVQCRGSWCYVEKRGPDGWVSANYLSRGGNPGWDDDWGWDRPPHWNPRPPRPPHWNPPRPWPQPQPWPGYGYPGNGGGSICFNGPNGYFCIGD